MLIYLICLLPCFDNCHWYVIELEQKVPFSIAWMFENNCLFTLVFLEKETGSYLLPEIVYEYWQHKKWRRMSVNAYVGADLRWSKWSGAVCEFPFLLNSFFLVLQFVVRFVYPVRWETKKAAPKCWRRSAGNRNFRDECLWGCPNGL